MANVSMASATVASAATTTSPVVWSVTTLPIAMPEPVIAFTFSVMRPMAMVTAPCDISDFEKEGIAIVKEIHSLVCQTVDSSCVSAEGLLHAFLEPFRFLCHHAVGLFIAVSHRIISSCPRVVKRSLVRSEVHADVLVCKPFPQIDHIALICDGHHFLVIDGLSDSRDELVEVCVDLIHPALAVSLVGGVRIDFCTHAHYA